MTEPEQSKPAEGPNVFEAVAKAAKAVKIAGKDKKNDFHGYDYRSIEAVMDAVHDAMAGAGVTICLSNMRNFQRTAVEVGREGKRSIEILVAYEGVFRVFGPRGDFFEIVHFCEGMDPRDKAGNKASTAGYKEVLQKIFTLPFGHDQAEADERPGITEPRRERRERRQEEPPAAAGAPDPKPAPGVEYRAVYPSDRHVIWQVKPEIVFKVVSELSDADLAELTNRIGRRIEHYEAAKQAAPVKDAKRDLSLVEAEKAARTKPPTPPPSTNTPPANQSAQKPADGPISGATTPGTPLPANTNAGYASNWKLLRTGKTFHGFKRLDEKRAEIWFTVKALDVDPLTPANEPAVGIRALIAFEDPPGSKPIEMALTKADFEDRFVCSGEVVDPAEALNSPTKPANSPTNGPNSPTKPADVPAPATAEAKAGDEMPGEAASLNLADRFKVSGTKALIDVDLAALKTMTAGEVTAMALDPANAALFATPFDPAGTEPLTAEWFVKAWIPFHEGQKDTKRDARKLALIAINLYRLGSRYDKLRPEILGPEKIAEEKKAVEEVKEMFGGKTARKGKASPLTD